MVCILLCYFKILLTVFNQSYNCQTSHYLGRNRLPKPFLILNTRYKRKKIWFYLRSLAWLRKLDRAFFPFSIQSNKRPESPLVNHKLLLLIQQAPNSSGGSWMVSVSVKKILLTSWHFVFNIWLSFSLCNYS